MSRMQRFDRDVAALCLFLGIIMVGALTGYAPWAAYFGALVSVIGFLNIPFFRWP